MKSNKSNILLYALLVGGLIGAGLAVIMSSRFISNHKKKKLERNNKFYEGIDDIFDSKQGDTEGEDELIDKETEDGIIDELFSRTN